MDLRTSTSVSKEKIVRRSVKEMSYCIEGIERLNPASLSSSHVRDVRSISNLRFHYEFSYNWEEAGEQGAFDARG